MSSLHQTLGEEKQGLEELDGADCPFPIFSVFDAFPM